MSNYSGRSGGCRRSRFKPLLRLAFPFLSKTPRSSSSNGVDLRSKFPAIEEQNDLSSCVGHALASMLEFLHFRFTGTTMDFSRLFIYYNARLLEDEVSNRNAIQLDEGADIQFALLGLMKFGCCEEQRWPFYPHLINTQPTNDAYLSAARFRVTEIGHLSNDIHELQQCLDDGFPFIMAIRVYKSFDYSPGGYIAMPKRKERPAKYRHAIVCIGYIHSERVFIIRNSYGELWGDRGYGYLPYAYVADKELCKDLWIIKSIQNVNDFESRENILSDYSFNSKMLYRDETFSSDEDEIEYSGAPSVFDQLPLPPPSPQNPVASFNSPNHGRYSFYTSMISSPSILRPY